MTNWLPDEEAAQLRFALAAEAGAAWFVNKSTARGVCRSAAGREDATKMIIEQQQMLTTQNLAALFTGLDLIESLRGQLGDMARQCFRWICKCHRMKRDDWQARLIMLKNTAYAWRQIVFFLALLPDRDVADFLRWAESHLWRSTRRVSEPIPSCAVRPDPCCKRSLDRPRFRTPDGARRVRGWSKEKHWLPG